MWEMAKIYGKWLKCLTNGLSMWEMTQRFDIFHKYFGNGLDVFCRA